jgi:asparagine N-glycosylation enzyme membrane subunit Stt3
MNRGLWNNRNYNFRINEYKEQIQRNKNRIQYLSFMIYRLPNTTINNQIMIELLTEIQQLETDNIGLKWSIKQIQDHIF